MQLYPNRRAKVKMRKFEIKRNPGSLLIEPANPSTHTPSTDPKAPVLEIIGEIVCLTAGLTLGWIAYVVF